MLDIKALRDAAGDRFVEFDEIGWPHLKNSKTTESTVLRRLALYEDNIPALLDRLDALEKELARAVVLPCKVGDAVWLIMERLRTKEFDIYESKVQEIKMRHDVTVISCWYDCPEIGNTLEYQPKDFGKTIFLKSAGKPPSDFCLQCGAYLPFYVNVCPECGANIENQPGRIDDTHAEAEAALSGKEEREP